ncbi:MAG: Rrf2 family transcriptional regulator [Coriobacteriia bacterium]|nr:Rrf2 family transcriptional regulator [Coriobacteriia bacterium]
MSIQWRTDYAIRLMYETARLGPGRRATVQLLARAGDVPYDFARQIANDLVHGGLLLSRRGPHGGMELARPAEEITILDIFEAVSEPPTMSLCTHADHVCTRKPVCPIHHGVWIELDESIRDELATKTLADAIARGEELAGKES